MNNKPWAYVTSAWSADQPKPKDAKRYCRKLYEAGYTRSPVTVTSGVIDVSNADEYKVSGYVRGYAETFRDSCGLWSR